MSSENTMTKVMSIMNISAAANVSSTNGQSKSKAQASFDSVFIKITDTVQNTVKADNRVNTKAQQNAKDASDTVRKSSTKDNDQKTVAIDNKDNTAKATEDIRNIKNVDSKNSTVENTESKSMEADDKLQKAIAEEVKELLSKISETFEVSEDEVIDAMEVLGLSIIDILNTQNLGQLINQISGQEKTLDLITDSELYTSLQDLLEGADDMRSQLMNEFDLSEKDLDEAISQTSKSFSEMLEEDSNKVVASELPLDKVNPANTNKNPEEIKIEVKEIDAPKEEEQVAPVNHNENAKQNKGNMQDSQQSGQTNLFNQFIENLTNAASEVTRTDSFTYTDRAQMENIIKQITDRITIMKGPEETSMELSLHPASLGNINVLLSSGKDGIIAKFTAQNEIVKEAVESQMVQLQQKFSEQGIKVTSIEVTIASHAFEQNLQQNDQNNAANEEQLKKSRKPVRRINLSELDEISKEVLDEGDKIAAEMMAANGNTVDYSA